MMMFTWSDISDMAGPTWNAFVEARLARGGGRFDRGLASKYFMYHSPAATGSSLNRCRCPKW